MSSTSRTGGPASGNRRAASGTNGPRSGAEKKKKKIGPRSGGRTGRGNPPFDVDDLGRRRGRKTGRDHQAHAGLLRGRLAIGQISKPEAVPACGHASSKRSNPREWNLPGHRPQRAGRHEFARMPFGPNSLARLAVRRPPPPGPAWPRPSPVGTPAPGDVASGKLQGRTTAAWAGRLSGSGGPWHKRLVRGNVDTCTAPRHVLPGRGRRKGCRRARSTGGRLAIECQHAVDARRTLLGGKRCRPVDASWFRGWLDIEFRWTGAAAGRPLAIRSTSDRRAETRVSTTCAPCSWRKTGGTAENRDSIYWSGDDPPVTKQVAAGHESSHA